MGWFERCYRMNEWLQKLLIIAGVVLVCIGIISILRIPYFYFQSSYQGMKLLHEDIVSIDHLKISPSQSSNYVQNNDPFRTNIEDLTPKNIGVLSIPTIHLKAPIIEGTSYDQLAKGVGHLKNSVMPGQNGSSILAAHNITWFHHIDQLANGDTIEIKTKEGTKTFTVIHKKVVHSGDPVYNTSHSTLVLETCYPLNTLHLTPYRFLVYAKLDSVK